MSVLHQLWPELAQTRETLGTDAQSLAPEVLLAVHQPMQFRRVEWGKQPSDSPIRNEHELLDALLAPESDGWTIVPIEGQSGVGKSHAVKWIEAQLRARNDGGLHVILVPKNSSLKSIIRLILDGLDGPEFDEIRAALERASEGIPEVAARQLRTQLVIALREEAKAAIQRRRAGERSQKNKEIEAGALFAALLDEPAFWEQRFLNEADGQPGVVMQIVHNLSHEGTIDLRRFDASDFQDLGELVAVKDLSKCVRTLVPMLQSATRREQVAALYNRVLDRATQSLLDLGGTSLSEVFLRLREALLARKQELVILVEDFAVLSGMQAALLRVLVQEGRVDGRRRYCTIRSALAYTSGTQTAVESLDTLQTRANVRWVIEDKLADEQEIIERAINLVGAYLNAARWGVAGLSALRVQRTRGEQGPRVPTHEPEEPDSEERDTIEAFGRSDTGVPLFPFNREAIATLVRDKCTNNNKLVFNPRLIINRIVFDVLEMRSHYESGQFPPPGLSTNVDSLVIAPDVVKAINAQSRDQSKRVLTFVSYWGDNPDSSGVAARLSPLLYRAFDVPVINFGAPTPAVKTLSLKPTSAGRTGSQQPEEIAASADPFEREWKDLLDKWQRGTRMLQKPANAIRKAMAAAMYASFAHDWAGSRPSWNAAELAAKYTHIPNARGGRDLTHDNAAIVLCEDEVWADVLRAAPYREELEAVLRFHDVSETNGRWDYSGGELQAAYYARFVARRRSRYLDAMAAERAKRIKVSTQTLVEERLLSAALLGHAVSGGNHFDSALEVLMRELPEQPIPSEVAADWHKLLELARRRASETWTQLASLIAVYQGRTGKKTLAIDIVEVESLAREFMKTWTLTGGSSDLRRPLDKGVASRRSELTQWRNSVIGWLGEGTNKDEFIAEIRGLLTEAKASKHEQLVSDEEVKALRGCLDRLRDARVSETLTKAERGGTGKWGSVTLLALAYHDAEAVRVTNELGVLLERTLKRIEGRLEQSAGSGAKARKQMAREVERELDQLRAALAPWQEASS